MIKYFIKNYGRYIAMALAFATVSFLINSCEVKAETGIQTTVLNYTGNTYSRNVRIFSNNNNIFSNWGRSYITFNVMLQTNGPNATLYPVEQINVFSTNNIFVCNIGNTNLNLVDSNTTILVYDVACDVNIGVNGIQAIDLTLYDIDGVYPLHITTSQYMTIYQNLDLNISQVLQQQQAITQGYLNTIHSAIDLNGQYIVNAIQGMQTQQIQAINNQTQQQHSDAQSQKESTDAINDSLNNDDTSGVSLDTITGQTNDVGAISGLITIPLTLLSSVITAFNGTCLPYNIGYLFGTNLIFPCIDLESILGSFLWDTIDILISGIFIFYISKKFVNLFNKLINLENIRLGVVDFV